MRKISAMALVALFGTAGVLLACDKHKAGKVVLAGAKVAPCSKATFDNAVAGVMKTMPSMAYRVGDTDTRCFKSATAKAGENGKVQFLVVDKAYDSETEATIALAGLLEKEIENLKAVQLSVGGKCYGCPMSAQAALKNGEKMKYRLAGFDFATREQAEKALKIVNCKLKGCDADCLKDCMKNVRGTAQTAGAKSGCNKGKATTVATVAAKSDKPCCAKGNKAKAATVAAKEGSPCNKSNAAKAATVAAKDGSPCNKSNAAKAATVAAKDGAPCPHALGAGAALTGAKKGGCNKAKAAKAATVAAKSDKPCCAKGNKAKAATVAAGDSPCSKSRAAKAATVAVKDGSPCSKSGAAKVSTVAAGGSPCSKAAKATTVAAESKGGCCKTAQKRLVTAQDQIKLIVETAATLALSS